MNQIPIEKITFKEVKDFQKFGCYLIHLSWLERRLPKLVNENQDCSYAVIDGDKHWNNPKAVLALVLDDDELEEKCGGKLDSFGELINRTVTDQDIIDQEKFFEKYRLLGV